MRKIAHVVIGTTALLASAVLLTGCFIEKIENAGSCDPDPCSGHGTCAVTDNSASCTCDTGYAGETCTTCTTGYHFTSDGTCQPDENCAALDCGPNGQCQVSDGVAACVCDPGYAQSGDACLATCDDGDGDFWGVGPGCLGPDNCPQVANFDQADIDGDGTGDMCDAEAISGMVWSPGGSRVAFMRCPPGQWEGCELWVAEADRSRARMIHAGISGVADWYRDAILFRADTGIGNPSSFDGSGEMYSIAPDGTNLTRITYTYSNGTHCHCNSYWEPVGTVAWAAFVRGTDLVYFKANNGNGWWRAYLANADGSDGQSTFSSGYAWWTGISPTGDVLLYTTATNYNQPMDLHAVTRGGGPDVVLASGLAPPVTVAVSPDGTKVAYQAGGASDLDVHVVGIDGTGDVAVVSDAYQDVLDGYYNGSYLVQLMGGNPWSADGQWLVFTSDRAGGTHLFKVHPDGTGLAQMTSGEHTQWGASFSPDGSRLAYHQLQSGFDPDAPLDQLVVEDW